MIEEIVIGGQSQHQPRASNGAEIVESRKIEGETSNIIDVDDYNYDEVIFIEVPAFSPMRVRDTRSIVCIDNEEKSVDDNDAIYVEVQESSGKLKEQWEKAFLRKQAKAKEEEELLLSQKKKDAESTRLLEIERRQNQRIEEVRETQKQDEDNLNLKEKLRSEIKRDLTKLESTCYDMASVLRGLGIQVTVDGPVEVRAASKRALLHFHPDKAPQSDMRQQVEAEEKFKLINRMKGKFFIH